MKAEVASRREVIAASLTTIQEAERENEKTLARARKVEAEVSGPCGNSKRHPLPPITRYKFVGCTVF